MLKRFAHAFGSAGIEREQIFGILLSIDCPPTAICTVPICEVAYILNVCKTTEKHFGVELQHTFDALCVALPRIRMPLTGL